MNECEQKRNFLRKKERASILIDFEIKFDGKGRPVPLMSMNTIAVRVIYEVRKRFADPFRKVCELRCKSYLDRILESKIRFETSFILAR